MDSITSGCQCLRQIFSVFRGGGYLGSRLGETYGSRELANLLARLHSYLISTIHNPQCLPFILRLASPPPINPRSFFLQHTHTHTQHTLQTSIELPAFAMIRGGFRTVQATYLKILRELITEQKSEFVLKFYSTPFQFLNCISIQSTIWHTDILL